MAKPIDEYAELSQMAERSPVSAPKPATSHSRLCGPADLEKTPNVGVIYNPRSHGNKGVDFDCGLSPQVYIAQPGDRSQLPEALAEFAAHGIELLVINGGDGTVRDVLTCGVDVFGDKWPAVAVLPKGKTNALTVDLHVPNDWSLQDAIDAFERGKRIFRRPIEVTPIGKNQAENAGDHVLGFILGAGAFTLATQSGQSAHKLGAFNSVVVAAATGWGLLQWIIASRANPWRRGARMNIKLGEQQAPMQHSGHGDPEWRQLLFASTLETLPAGFQPFGEFSEGIKMVVIDQVTRRSNLLIPLISRGKRRDGLQERGIHQTAASQFNLEIGDQFILDGEAFDPGEYRIAQGPELEFVTP